MVTPHNVPSTTRSILRYHKSFDDFYTQSVRTALAQRRHKCSAWRRSPHHRAIPVQDFSRVNRNRTADAACLDAATIDSIRGLLTPLVCIAPGLVGRTDSRGAAQPNNTEAKIRRSAPAVALHDAICADTSTLTVYTDASVRDDGSHAGAGATVPAFNRTLVQYLGIYTQSRRTAIAEFAAIVLGLEEAAKCAAYGQTVALFTDIQYEKHFTAVELKDEHVQRAMARAHTAIQKLQQNQSPFKLYWVPGHRNVIDGIIVAHRAANEASRSVDEIRRRLILGPYITAGVAIDNIGVMTKASRQLYMPAFPQKYMTNGLATDGMGVVKPFVDNPAALSQRSASPVISSQRLQSAQSGN